MTSGEFFNKVIVRSTNGVKVIDTDHAYIHKKKGYNVIGSTTIANGGSYKITFKTPDCGSRLNQDVERMYVHWRPALIYGLAGGVIWSLYQGSTGISGGTASDPINANHNATEKHRARTSVLLGTTVTGNGTLKQVAGSGTAGNPAQANGGGSSAQNEKVLLSDTYYTLVIENQLAGNNLTVFDLF